MGHPFHPLRYACSWVNWGSKILAVTFLNLHVKVYIMIDIQLALSSTFQWLIHFDLIVSNMHIFPAQVYQKWNNEAIKFFEKKEESLESCH